MDKALSESFTTALTSLDINPEARILAALTQYHHLLVKWRAHFNLSAGYQLSSWWLHLLDSLAVAKVLSLLHVKHCLDLGSGAGFPIIACAIIHPQIRFVASEIDHNKSAFLRQAMTQCALANLQLVGDWKRMNGNPHRVDAVTSKAFLTPDHFLQIFPSLVGTGGLGIICQSAPQPTLKRPTSLLKSAFSYRPPTLTAAQKPLNDWRWVMVYRH